DWIAASRIRWSRAGNDRSCLSASSVMVILKAWRRSPAINGRRSHFTRSQLRMSRASRRSAYRISSPHYLCKRSLEERHLVARADGDANMSRQRRPGAADGDVVPQHAGIDLPARPPAINHDHVRLRGNVGETAPVQPGAKIVADVGHDLPALRNQCSLL